MTIFFKNYYLTIRKQTPQFPKVITRDLPEGEYMVWINKMIREGKWDLMNHRPFV